MAVVDASGVVSGSSTASGVATVSTFASATFVGMGGVVVTPGVVRLASARFDGVGRLEWAYVKDAAATFSGTSALAGSGLVARYAAGVFLGSSAFQHSAPLRIVGTSSMAVAPVVDRHLPPLRAITMGPKTFGWQQPLQRGDLSVFVCDGTGPVVPSSISYRLMHVRLNGSRQQVGPRTRTPVAGMQGEFYVTGRAGEHGQPGQWIVEWTFQRTGCSTPQVVELPFMVLDAVMAGIPGDVTCRKVKFGWN